MADEASDMLLVELELEVEVEVSLDEEEWLQRDREELDCAS